MFLVSYLGAARRAEFLIGLELRAAARAEVRPKRRGGGRRCRRRVRRRRRRRTEERWQRRCARWRRSSTSIVVVVGRLVLVVAALALEEVVATAAAFALGGRLRRFRRRCLLRLLGRGRLWCRDRIVRHRLWPRIASARQKTTKKRNMSTRNAALFSNRIVRGRRAQGEAGIWRAGLRCMLHLHVIVDAHVGVALGQYAIDHARVRRAVERLAQSDVRT
jgi:hypothetical protein